MSNRNLADFVAVPRAEIDKKREPSARLAAAVKLSDYLFGAAMCAPTPADFYAAKEAREAVIADYLGPETEPAIIQAAA